MLRAVICGVLRLHIHYQHVIGAFVARYVGGWVGVSVGGVLYVLLVVVLYCCKTPLHRACGWVANRLVLGPLVVLQRCGLLPYVLLRYVQFFATTPAM